MTGGHSASVQMWLHLPGESFPVLQSSEHEIRVDRSLAIRVGSAILEIVVDGRSHRHSVQVLSPADATGWMAIADEATQSGILEV
jgi:hypothetical protein